MQLTEFGKFIRKYRIDHNILLKQMADKLEVSSAFLSAVETGVKAIPMNFEEKILAQFSFSDDERHGLFQSVDSSRTQATIQVPNNKLDQQVLGAFCRQFDSLSKEQKKKIIDVLNGGK